MTALHTLGILSTSFTWNAFPTVLKEFPHMLSTFPSLCGPTHPKPSQLGWDCVFVEARSSDAALHRSPSWSNSTHTAWWCVGSLSCWKTNDSPTNRKLLWTVDDEMCLLLEFCEAFIWAAISEVKLTLINFSSAAEVIMGLPFLWRSSWEPVSSLCLMVFATALEETFKVLDRPSCF